MRWNVYNKKETKAGVEKLWRNWNSYTLLGEWGMKMIQPLWKAGF